jgi:hypothetical protein
LRVASWSGIHWSVRVVEDHAPPELELPGHVVHETPRLGQLGHDAALGVAPDERVEG